MNNFNQRINYNRGISMYVFFGAGEYGKKAIQFLGKQNVKMFLDNDINKNGKYLEGVIIHYFDDAKSEIGNCKVVITVSPEKYKEISLHLKENGVNEFITFNELKTFVTREKVLRQLDNTTIYKKAIQWIIDNSIDGEGITVSTSYRKSYPEVTGYYIPSLIKWGYQDLAKKYAKWLCKIQKEDGSWFDADDKNAYIFDSAQILKGLLSSRDFLPEVEPFIIKGCEWILSRMNHEGRLITPSTEAWGNNRDMCDEIIHIYCLSPLYDAGKVYGKEEYIDKANKIKKFYLETYREKIMNFSLLSHFYAYLMEALIDIGEIDMAKEAMSRIECFQEDNGIVPAYNNVHWICSTGLFQLALVWFRLGNINRGKRAFEYACKLQNPTGGWFGSYLNEKYSGEDNNYFPEEEISWANKYFLDALYYKEKLEFENMADIYGRK